MLTHAVQPCRAPLVRLELEASVDPLEERETLDPPDLLDLLDSLDLLLVTLCTTNTCTLNCCDFHLSPKMMTNMMQKWQRDETVV